MRIDIDTLRVPRELLRSGNAVAIEAAVRAALAERLSEVDADGVEARLAGVPLSIGPGDLDALVPHEFHTPTSPGGEQPS